MKPAYCRVVPDEIVNVLFCLANNKCRFVNNDFLGGSESDQIWVVEIVGGVMGSQHRIRPRMRSLLEYRSRNRVVNR